MEKERTLVRRMKDAHMVPTLNLDELGNAVVAAESAEATDTTQPQKAKSNVQLERVNEWRQRLARRSTARRHDTKPKKILKREDRLFTDLEHAWIAVQEHEAIHGLSSDGSARLLFIVEKTEVDIV